MTDFIDGDYKYDLWLVLRALQRNHLETGRLGFSFETDSVQGLSSKDVIGKLRYLDNQGGIKYEPPNMAEMYESQHSEFPGFSIGDVHPRVVYIELHEQKFSELYEEFSQQAEASQAKIQTVNKMLTVRLMKDGLNLYLQSSNGERVNLKRLRTDLTPVKLLDYLIAHPNTVIQLSQLKLEGSGFSSVKNVGERLRKAGFTETVKRYFLPDNDSQKVRLKVEAEMSSVDFEKIKSELLERAKSE